MDTLRGYFSGPDAAEDRDFELAEDDTGQESPPSAIGQDERRMQVRAYNHWASLLRDRNFPSIDDLDAGGLPDFGPYSVLLDFTVGIEDPAIRYLGDRLADECAGEGTIRNLADVPNRSLLSRITDHYMQILANQAPIGFEAEFVNQRGATILYRGILLPFSSDDAAIDFIYGVINWKEMADQQASDALLLEIEQALDDSADFAVLTLDTPAPESPAMSEWADGPADDNVLDLVTPLDESGDALDWPAPVFGGAGPLAPSRGAIAVPTLGAQVSQVSFAGAAYAGQTAEPLDTDAMALGDWLSSARELARAAQGNEDRSRHTLYAAIGRAYDFSLAAAAAPGDFQALVVDAGLTVQDRAPMTPVVKLVFGADYDKTRLTEYASALAHAHRLRLDRGRLADHLLVAPGGLKGIVQAERKLKREESGKPASRREAPRDALARKLRQLDHQPLDQIASEGSEFTLVVARRLPHGQVVLLGEVGDDIGLLERAARHLIG